MKSSQIRKLAVAAAAASACVLSSGAALANSTVFEGVTITLTADADTVFLSLLNAQSATGTWANATQLNAFSFNNFGSAVMGAANNGFSGPYDTTLNNAICLADNVPAQKEDCYSGSMAISDNMSLEIAYSGAAFDVDTATLKLHFADDSGAKVGSLYSATVPVPEPETYALMLAGLGVVGFMARRRRLS